MREGTDTFIAQANRQCHNQFVGGDTSCGPPPQKQKNVGGNTSVMCSFVCAVYILLLILKNLKN